MKKRFLTFILVLFVLCLLIGISHQSLHQSNHCDLCFYMSLSQWTLGILIIWVIPVSKTIRQSCLPIISLFIQHFPHSNLASRAPPLLFVIAL